MLSTFLFIFIQLGSQALAAQTAVVNVRATYLYEKADHRSPILTEIFEGESIEVSSVPFSNSYGELWYKSKTRGKQVGFVPSNDIMTAEFAEAEIKKGHDPYAKRRNPEIDADPRWTSILIIQAAGFVTPPPSAFAGGGQLEWLGNLGPKRPGFDYRRWGLGAGLLMTSNRRALYLAAAGRAFLDGALGEPELRLRLGRDFYTGAFLLGAALAYRRPFLAVGKIESVSHWGWDVEGGVVSVLAERDQAIQFGIAIGIHKTFE